MGYSLKMNSSFTLLALLLYLIVSWPVHSQGTPGGIPDDSSGKKESPSSGPTGKSYVRGYEIYDARFCYLTPSPFICEKCLRAEEQFVQILRFEADGIPFRSYECRPWKRPYLDR